MGEQGCLFALLFEASGGLDPDFHFSVIIAKELLRSDGFGLVKPDTAQEGLERTVSSGQGVIMALAESLTGRKAGVIVYRERPFPLR